MEFDDWTLIRGESVVQGPGIVGEGAGVDNDGGDAVAGGMDCVDEVAFMVAL